ncbi:Uncharacterised protein [Pseudomonas luteola]|uniref:Uncharacterized protein n=2 Tax=Pseudomonas TaxID=286 RepID=A0A2X2CCB2_PSELU|nr:hypothetical protein SAMN05216409_114104 [Pseudomonas lutea]SPZ04984.1 Uncharacterised protein [Pseudomonas luteola]
MSHADHTVVLNTSIKKVSDMPYWVLINYLASLSPRFRLVLLAHLARGRA